MPGGGGGGALFAASVSKRVPAPQRVCLLLRAGRGAERRRGVGGWAGGQGVELSAPLAGMLSGGRGAGARKSGLG